MNQWPRPIHPRPRGRAGTQPGCPRWGRRKAEAEISESPRCLTFPALEKMRIVILNRGRNSHLLDELGHFSDSGQRNRLPASTGICSRPQNVLWVGLHEPAGFSVGQTEPCSKEDPRSYRIYVANAWAAEERNMSGAEDCGSRERTVSQSDLRYHHKRRRCSRRYALTCE